ncbi:MAG: T9SS type A sorting domain-containing protein [Candidatus Eisenbacteria bacterium]
MGRSPSLVFAVGLTLVAGIHAHADWAPNGNVVCDAPGQQGLMYATNDGAGGAIIMWPDFRDGVIFDIYAQRIDAVGDTLWQAGGVPICTAPTDLRFNAGGATKEHKIIGDGDGGAIMVWDDLRIGAGWNIYAQRVDSLGTPLWTPDGHLLCDSDSSQILPTLAMDGAGGAIVAWMDYRSSHPNEQDTDIYAQRVDADGNLLWGASGTRVSTRVGSSVALPQTTSDGVGGAFIVWEELGSVYAQHITASGDSVSGWPSNGARIGRLGNAGGYSYAEIIGDGLGGAYVVWHWAEYGLGAFVYAQRLDPVSGPVWDSDGLLVGGSVLGEYGSYTPSITSDGSGGAFVSWIILSLSGDQDVYAQRLNSAGQALWGTGGIPVCADPAYQANPVIESDSLGGAFVVWEDLRNGTTNGMDIYSQYLDGAGNPLWTIDGEVICCAEQNQIRPRPFITDSLSALFFWVDERAGNRDLYAGKRLAVTTGISSLPGGARPSLLLYPNPAREASTLLFDIPDEGSVSLDVYSIGGRLVRRLTNDRYGRGSHVLEWDGRDQSGRRAPSGVYFVRLQDGEEVESQRLILLR